MPCTLTYLLDEGGAHLKLVATTGVDADHPAASLVIDPAETAAAWPIRQILSSNRALLWTISSNFFSGSSARMLGPAAGPCAAGSIARQGQDKPVGIFIAALNPYRQFDAYYEGFLDLITGQIAASITTASAYEHERRRAEELAELDRAKTAFFSNVSHEYEPLLPSFWSYRGCPYQQSPPSPQSLEMLHRNALRLLKLVNGLLDFVRIEVGKLRAAYEATDLSLLTAQLASVFRSAVERGRAATGGGLPTPSRTCVCGPGDVGEDRSQSHLERVQIHIRRRDPGQCASRRRASAGFGKRHRNGHLGTRSSQSLSTLRAHRRARRRSHEGSGIGLALCRNWWRCTAVNPRKERHRLGTSSL